MRTIRARLTAWYSAALLVALAVFGVALYFNPPRPSTAEFDRRTLGDATFAVHYLEESHRVLGPLVARDPAPSLDPGIGAAFEALQSYFVILGRGDTVLYLSPRARGLDFSGLQHLLDLTQPRPSAGVVGTVRFDDHGNDLRYRVQPFDGAGSDIATILVATPIDPAPIDAGSLLGAMLLASPIVLVASLGLGYWLAGRALQPVQGIIDELEAITDGVSLHRRVVVPMAGDEITRLALGVNAMLARLEQSFASLRRFTADASHELKTPLMVLRAGVERVLTHPKSPPEMLQTLDETLEQINRMSEMVESLLTLARADEGRAPLALEPTDMRAIMIDIAETAGILGEEHGLRVETELPDHPVMVPMDAPRIRELLLNLVTNAIKYTPTGGMVRLGLEDGAGEVAIRVKDTGIGIAAGDLPHIFDRFWRADPARSRTGERSGTGLGLAITKWIAEAHGGTITVQSRPGRGTTFLVTLPKAATSATAVSAA